MNINEALSRLDLLIPNTYYREIKIKWLSSIEELLINNVFSKFKGIPGPAMQYVSGGFDRNKDEIHGTEINFVPFTDDTPGETELIVSQEYDEIYIHWLASKIHFYNDEILKYNNASIAYNDLLTELRNHYAKTHMPLQTGVNYF